MCVHEVVLGCVYVAIYSSGFLIRVDTGGGMVCTVGGARLVHVQRKKMFECIEWIRFSIVLQWWCCWGKS